MKELKIYISIASALLIIYLIAQVNKPKPIDWTPTYHRESKIPLGTYILYNSLPKLFPGAKIKNFREPVYNVTTDHSITDATYLIVAGNVHLYEADIKRLLTFVKSGNDVLICANDFGNDLYKKLKVDTYPSGGMQNNADSIHFVSKHNNPGKKYPLRKELTQYYLGEIDTVHMVSLAQNTSGGSTYIKYSLGKGTLYLCTEPFLFSNFNLLNTAGAEAAAKTLSFLKNNKNILWDDFYTLGREGEASPMRVIFKSVQLKWAYLISLITLVIFVCYEMKRRQRIIPVTDPLANSTLSFVNVVGQLYYEQRNNRNISDKKITYFLEYLRNKYYLKTNLLNSEFIANLSQKTGISLPFANELVAYITQMETKNAVTDKELITLNHLIEKFYSEAS